MSTFNHWKVLAAVFLLAACAGPPADTGGTRLDVVELTASPVEVLAGLDAYCGRAFPGQVVVDEPPGAHPEWQQGPVVLHLRGCELQGRILVPIRGNDRGIVWMLGQSGEGLYLRQNRYHEDGSLAEDPPPVAGIGRVAQQPTRVEFDIDERSREALAERGIEGRSNMQWTLELDAHAQQLRYEERWTGGRLRVEFDLGQAVEVPGQSWFEQPIR